MPLGVASSKNKKKQKTWSEPQLPASGFELPRAVGGTGAMGGGGHPDYGAHSFHRDGHALSVGPADLLWVGKDVKEWAELLQELMERLSWKVKVWAGTRVRLDRIRALALHRTHSCPGPGGLRTGRMNPEQRRCGPNTPTGAAHAGPLGTFMTVDRTKLTTTLAGICLVPIVLDQERGEVRGHRVGEEWVGGDSK